MFGWFRSKEDETEVPHIPFEEIKKRARLLVIDDQGFTYKALFESDGYTIAEWRDVEDLSKLENSFYDVILLDVNGVGKMLSNDQGLGVLQHIRHTSPTQVVIAFSNAKFDLKYQEFFNQADAVLSKDSDYVDFKRKVDELLRRRFSVGFYVSRISVLLGSDSFDRMQIEREVRKSINQKESSPMRQYLKQKTTDPKTVETVLGIVKAAVEVYNTWSK